MSGNLELDMNHAIETAFRKLNPPKEKDPDLQRAIKTIRIVCEAPQKQTSPSFRNVGKRKTDLELKKIVGYSKKLAQHLASLHGPAVLALADLGLHEIRITLPPLLKKVARAVQEELIVKTNIERIGVTNQDLNQKQAKPIDDKKSVKGGRPINLHANAIAVMLSHYYHELTEKEPTLIIDPYSKTSAASGPFLELVTSIFKAAGIRSNAEHAARLAVKARRNRKEKT